MDIEELQGALGYAFADSSLLLEALTHATWLKEEHDQGRDIDCGDQQRLEFLGDAFLGYVIGQAMFHRFPDAAEGELTKERSFLVKGSQIREIGVRLGLLDLVRIGRGERKNLARNKKVLEDSVEALIGAVLEDGGEEEARRVVQRLFLSGGLEGQAAGGRNPISEYTERWQRQFRESPPTPIYEPSGPDDAPIWCAWVAHPLGDTRRGTGQSKVEARRDACTTVLDSWEDCGDASGTHGYLPLLAAQS